MQTSLPKPIPPVLLPYLSSVANISKQQDWLLEIYNDEILPLANEAFKEFIGENVSQKIVNLEMLQDYFLKRKKQRSYESNFKLVNLRHKLCITDKIKSNIEYSFYKSIVLGKPGFSFQSFLPLTLNKILPSILHIQVLLNILEEIAKLESAGYRSQVILLKQWASKELKAKNSLNSNVLNNYREYNYIGPSKPYYFFNGAQHLFLSFQLEYNHLLKMYNETLHLVSDIKNLRLDFNKIIHIITFGQLNFIMNLFIVSLSPYRFVRTAVNHSVNLVTVYAQDKILRKTPLVAKREYWEALSLILQMATYLALIVLTGLPLLPLPLAYIPEALVGVNMLYGGMAYLVSTFFCAGCMACIDKIYRDHKQVKPLEEDNVVKIATVSTNKANYGFKSHLYDIHRLNSQPLFVHSDIKNTLKKPIKKIY